MQVQVVGLDAAIRQAPSGTGIGQLKTIEYDVQPWITQQHATGHLPLQRSESLPINTNDFAGATIPH